MCDRFKTTAILADQRLARLIADEVIEALVSDGRLVSAVVLPRHERKEVDGWHGDETASPSMSHGSMDGNGNLRSGTASPGRKAVRALIQKRKPGAATATQQTKPKKTKPRHLTCLRW